MAGWPAGVVHWPCPIRSEEPRLSVRRSAVTALPLVLVLGAGPVLSGCTSATGPGIGSSTTVVSTLDVQTPAGAVTISLDEQLPVGWPADFPVPDTATPAGSGVLAGAAPTTQIGAFTVAQPPDEVFTFYEQQAGLAVASASSAGTGDEFDGTVRLEGASAGLVTVVGVAGGATIVAVLQGPEGSGPSPDGDDDAG